MRFVATQPKFLLCLFFHILTTSTISVGKSPWEGRVIDWQTGLPVRAAVVTLLPLQSWTQTDSGGYFQLSLPGLPTGIHLHISHLAYQPLDTQLQLTGIQSTPAIFQLSPRIRALKEISVMPHLPGERTPVAVTRLNSVEIEPVNLGQDMPFLLQQTPGLLTHSDAGAGIGYTGMRIRGTDGTRINVTLNGVPVNDAESQGVFWVNMPDLASSAEAIEIQRGVGTSTSGTGAFGGSVHIKTRLSADTPGVRLTTSGGSFGTIRQSAAVSSGQLGGGWEFGGRISRIQSRGYIERARSDLRSLALGAVRKGTRSRLSLNLLQGNERTYQAWYGVPQDSLATRRTFNPAGAYTDAEGTPRHHPDEVDNYRQDHYQAIYELDPHQAIALKATLFYTRGAGYYEQYRSGETYAQYGLNNPRVGGDTLTTTDFIRRRWLDNHFYGGLLQTEWKSGPWQWQSGGGWYRYSGKHFGEVVWAAISSGKALPVRYYENDGLKSEFHAFTRTEWEAAPQWHLFGDLQLRGVDYQFAGLNNQSVAVDQNLRLRFFNPKAGVNWQAGPYLRCYASVAVGHREPVRDDLTASTPESRPGAERLTDWETGIRWKGRTYQLEIQTYYMVYRDQLVLNGQINDVGGYVRVNVPQSYRLGTELSWSTQLHSRLEWTGNLCLSQNRVRNYTEYFDLYDSQFNYLGNVVGQTFVTAPIAFSPGITSATSLSWKLSDGIRINWLTRYTGRQYLDNSGDPGRALPSWMVQDLRFDLHSGKKSGRPDIRLHLLVANLFNERYSANGYTYPHLVNGNLTRDNYYFPQATRNILAGLQVQF